MFKRCFDFVLAALGLILLSPLFLLISIAIKMDSEGPVFYRGARVGRKGKLFHIYKFRSMVVNAEKVGASTTSEADARVTRMGKFIRKYKLDELTQLINVCLGDMSLVGPRPQVQWAVEKYTEAEKRVLQLRPGITDWASIKFHNEGEIIEKSGMPDPDEAYFKFIHPEKMRLQSKYLHEQTVWIDLKIILMTLLTIFSSRMSVHKIGTERSSQK